MAFTDNLVKGSLDEKGIQTDPVEKTLLDHTRDIAEIAGKLTRIDTIVFLGFLIIIIMFGTLLVTVWLSFISSNDQSTNYRLDRIERRIDNLESSPAAR